MNPYAASRSPQANKRRAVWRFLIGAVLLATLGVLPLIPGLFLLNQELGVFPVNSSVSDIEFNGHRIEIRRVIAILLVTGVSCLTTCITFAIRFAINWRRNQRSQCSNIASAEDDLAAENVAK